MTTSSSQSQPHLAYAALNVVLAYWMIPNLGWSTDMYETKLLAIRDAIISDRLRYESSLDKLQVEQMRKRLYKHYEQEFLYCDTTHSQLLKDELEEESIEGYMANLQIEPDEEAEEEDVPYYAVQDVREIICNFVDKYMKPKIWIIQHQLISAVLYLRKIHLRMRCSIHQLFHSQQKRWNNINALMSYQLIAWNATLYRLHLMEAVLFDFALMPLSFESELDNEKENPLIEETSFAYDDAIDALNKAKTHCTGNHFCDQTSISRVVHDFESAAAFYDIQINRLNYWRDNIPCGNFWVSEPQSFTKMVARSWIQSMVSLLSSISTCQANMEFGITPRMRQTEDLKTVMEDYELCVMSDIYDNVYYICSRLNGGQVYLLYNLMEISHLLHDILIEHTNSPTPSSPLVHKIVHEALNCISHSLAMKHTWIGSYIGNLSAQSYLYHQLATIMSDIASVGRRICPDRHNPNQITKIAQEFFSEFYALGKVLCNDLQDVLTLDGNKFPSALAEYSLYLAKFKPLLQIYYGEERQMKHHFTIHIIISLTNLTHYLSEWCITSSKPERLIFLKTFNRVYIESTHNNLNDVAFELLMYQQFSNIALGFALRYSNAKEDLSILSGLWDQWINLHRSKSDIVMFDLLRKLLKIKLFIALLEHNAYNRSEGETLFYWDSKKEVLKFKPEPQRIIRSIPCDQLYDKLHTIEHDVDTSRTGTNLEMLKVFLFWVEKTLEVQMMRYELITSIRGVLEIGEGSVQLSGSFVDELLASLNWIEDVGMCVSTMSSIFKLAFINKEFTDESALTWLSTESIVSFSSRCGLDEQMRATQCMKEVALKWKAEYALIVNNGIQKQKEEGLTEHSTQSLSGIFSLFSR